MKNIIEKYQNFVLFLLCIAPSRNVSSTRCFAIELIIENEIYQKNVRYMNVNGKNRSSYFVVVCIQIEKEDAIVVESCKSWYCDDCYYVLQKILQLQRNCQEVLQSVFQQRYFLRYIIFKANCYKEVAIRLLFKLEHVWPVERHAIVLKD